MKVRVTSTIILDDNHWGFTDLIEKRLICQEVIDEIKDLIMEDSSELNDPDNWKVEILNQNKDE